MSERRMDGWMGLEDRWADGWVRILEMNLLAFVLSLLKMLSLL